MKILVLGANGFIGHSLIRRILASEDWSVVGLDLHWFRLGSMLDHPRLAFHRADLMSDHALVDRLIEAADVVLPLAAFATPATYVRWPLATFELDFEANLRVIRMTARMGRRLVFPSTSEVYGMCEDAAFSERDSRLVMGPVHNDRWIYGCSKQLLDRVIWALRRDGLDFTIFRPFNWFGPCQDDIGDAAPGSSRVVTQFLGHLLRGEQVSLVDGGSQRRTFTYIDDGIDALMCILRNEGGRASGQIVNLGNPANVASIREVGALLADEVSRIAGFADRVARPWFRNVSGEQYYGSGFEDVGHREPAIEVARWLGWEPRIGLREGIRRLLAAEVDSGAWMQAAASAQAVAT